MLYHLIDRSREKVDPCNWELQLNGGQVNFNKKTIKLIDDSSTSVTKNDAGITEYNVVSFQGGSTIIQKCLKELIVVLMVNSIQI